MFVLAEIWSLPGHHWQTPLPWNLLIVSYQGSRLHSLSKPVFSLPASQCVPIMQHWLPPMVLSVPANFICCTETAATHGIKDKRSFACSSTLSWWPQQLEHYRCQLTLQKPVASPGVVISPRISWLLAVAGINWHIRSCPKVATHSINIYCPFYKVLGQLTIAFKINTL